MVSILGQALGEFNKDIEGRRLEDRIESEGAVLDGVDSAAGRLFGNDPDSFALVAQGIGTLALKAQGISPAEPQAFNAASGAKTTQSVVHDPATLIAAAGKVTRVGAGGGLENTGDVDVDYKPNYEGPAWTGRSLTSN